MPSSTPASSSYPTARSTSADSRTEISVAAGREATSALDTLEQETTRNASFHPPRHPEPKAGRKLEGAGLRENEALRSDMPNMTGP